jgi:hypothetical protein
MHRLHGHNIHGPDGRPPKPTTQHVSSLNGGPAITQTQAINGSRETPSLPAANASRRRSDEVPVSSHRRIRGDDQQGVGYKLREGGGEPRTDCMITTPEAQTAALRDVHVQPFRGLE